jgi:hypothetical protein
VALVIAKGPEWLAGSSIATCPFGPQEVNANASRLLIAARIGSLFSKTCLGRWREVQQTVAGQPMAGKRKLTNVRENFNWQAY